jgi:hypothetical protein
MKSRGLVISLILFLLPVLPIWLIPSQAFSADRAWPRFYIEPSTTFLFRTLVEDAYTLQSPGGRQIPSTSPSVESIQFLLKLGTEITPNIELYGLIGGSNLQMDDLNFHSGVVPAYGAGTRLKMQPGFYQEERLSLFLDYRFLTYQATADGIVFNPTDTSGKPAFTTGAGTTVYEIASEKVNWQEHVIKFGASGRRGLLEPYGGFELSFVDTSHKVTSQPGSPFLANQLDLHIHGDIFFGLFAGIYIYQDPTERQALFVELHAADEDSVTLGYRMNF